jgi:hypothetical protein
MKHFLVALFMLHFFSAFSAEEKAADYKKSDYQIDWQYKAGEYLIYDCEFEHYACVNEDGDKTCRDDRAEAMEKKRPKYPCAPLKKFADKKACVLESYKIVDRNTIRRFCYPK